MPRARKPPHPLVLGGMATGLVACLMLAVAGPEESDAVLWASRGLFAFLATMGSLTCLRLSRGVTSDRQAWALVVIGIATWLAGAIVYWATEPGTDPTSYPWATNVLYLGFYVAILLGLHVMAGNDRLRSPNSFGMVVGLLGIASLWAWLVTTGSLFSDGGEESTLAQAIVYPALDVALIGAAGLVMATRNRIHEYPLRALVAGLVLIAIADSLYGFDLAGSTLSTSELVLNPIWASGLLLIALAPWLSQPRRSQASDDRPAMRLALGAAMVSLLILAWDHFERVSAIALILATLTVLASTVQIALLYRQRVRAELEVHSAAVRSARALALTIDAKDKATHSHSDRVGKIVEILGRELGYDAERLDRLILAGTLHDIGKISIPEQILMKPSGLTDSEYELIKAHTTEGEQIVATAGLGDIAIWIRHHHERWDGGGYPDRLEGEEIPLESRILGVADSLDAMVSDRPYRKGMPIGDAQRELRNSAGSQFDPSIVALLLDLIERDELDLTPEARPLDELETQIESELAKYPAPPLAVES